MAKCRPSKWVLPAFLGAGLPLLAAAVYEVSSNKMTDAISGRATSALSGDTGNAWASIESDRRDFVLRGTAPSQEAVDKAVAAVAGSYGVRTIAQNIQIVAPVKLTAPTVESLNSAEASPTIKGTWPEGVAKTLAVALAGTTYKLGESPELTTQAGAWTLKAPALAEGSYDVTAEASDGTETLAATAGKLVIDLPEPAAPAMAVKLAAPTVMPYLGNSATPSFMGTWPEAEAKTASSNLQVKAGETTYVLGVNPELKTDGAGNWSLTPSLPLLEGELEVLPALVAADGTLTPAAEPAKAVVDLTPPPVPEILAPAAGAVWPYAIVGKWAEAAGAGLVATVAGQTYAVNRDAELSSDGKGNFTLQPSAKLAPGSYDIDFTVNDAAGNLTTQKLVAAIVVPEPAAPPPPVVAATPAAVNPAAMGAVWPYAITGTWDEKPGNTLSATVEGSTYKLGDGPELTSDGAGKFSFAPSAKFAPGSYDIDFTTNDATGEPKVTTVKAGIVVPEPAPPPPPKKELPAPTVVSQLDLTGAPIIKGTWPHDQAKGLSVTVSGRTYTLGTDANLRAKDGNWSLFPGSALKDGMYDVDAVATDEGVTAADSTSKELQVAVTQPAAPAVISMSGDVSPAQLMGTWDQAMAKTLKVSIPQISLSAELGASGSPLSSDGAGNWLLNLAQPLAVGTYNVVAETADQYGRVQTDGTEGEVVIVAKGETPAVRSVAPYDCAAVMARISNVFPIRFQYDLTDITKPFDLSVSQFAALLKDPRCASLNIEVQGYADFKGSESYNLNLSERRAEIIIGMLKGAGVDPSRMSPKAFGESQPLDSALTDEARMKNRRVEITVKP